MKKLFYTLLFALLYQSQAECQIRSRVQPWEYDMLKKTTSIFLVRTVDEDKLDEIQAILDSTWTYTKAIAVPVSQRSNYPDTSNEYSFFTVAAHKVLKIISNNGMHQGIMVPLYLFQLAMYTTGTKKEIPFFEINLFPVEDKRNVLFPKLFVDSTDDYFNWTLGHLATYLKSAQPLLENRIRCYFSDTVIKEQELVNLKHDTLYLPEYVTYKKANIRKKRSPAKYLSRYGHPCKVVSENELDSLILHSNRTIYFLDYFSLDFYHKVITIYNSTTGKIVYKEDVWSEFLRSKDMKKLGKMITNLPNMN